MYLHIEAVVNHSEYLATASFRTDNPARVIEAVTPLIADAIETRLVEDVESSHSQPDTFIEIRMRKDR